MNFPSYQLKIGVSGHRELNDIDAVRNAVQNLLRQLNSIFNDQNSQDQSLIEFSIISSLAKGADQLVTEEALNILDSKIEFVAPMPVEEYRKDFKEDPEIKQFESLASMDQFPTVLNHDSTLESADRDLRNQAYLDAGKYVVDSCEILIVVWDGKAAQGVGGTGDVVRYAMTRNRTTIWLDVNQPEQPVVQLISETEKPSESAGFCTQQLSHSAKQLSPGFHRFRSFILDSIVPTSDVGHASQAFLTNLQSAAKSSGMDSDSYLKVERLSTLLSKADLMAIAYQRRYVFAVKSLFRLSALAVSIALFQVLFFPHQLWMITFEIAAMILAASLLFYSRRETWHEKWLNDRFIAEWLRTQIFIGTLGSRSNNSDHAENPLPFYTGPDDWFRAAFSPLIESSKKSMSLLETKAIRNFLVHHWLRPQAEWHSKNSKTKEKEAAISELAGTVFFLITILMATLHLFGVGHTTHAAAKNSHAVIENSHGRSEEVPHHASEEESAHEDSSSFTNISIWITFFAIVLPAWGAANHAIASMLEHERIATRSHKMASILSELANRASMANSSEELNEIVNRASMIIEMENHEWIASLSFQAPKLPA